MGPQPPLWRYEAQAICQFPLPALFSLSRITREKAFLQPFPRPHGQPLQVMEISLKLRGLLPRYSCAWTDHWSWSKFLVHGLCCQPSGLPHVRVCCPIIFKGKGENRGHQGKIKHLCRPCSALLAQSNSFTQLLSWQFGKWRTNVFGLTLILLQTLETKPEGKRAAGELRSSCAPWLPQHHRYPWGQTRRTASWRAKILGWKSMDYPKRWALPALLSKCHAAVGVKGHTTALLPKFHSGPCKEQRDRDNHLSEELLTSGALRGYGWDQRLAQPLGTLWYHHEVKLFPHGLN